MRRNITIALALTAAFLVVICCSVALAAKPSAPGATSMLSVSTTGEQGNAASGSPSVSADGNLVVFNSNATNLDALDTGSGTDVFLRNRSAGTTILVSTDIYGAPSQASYYPVIGGNGGAVAFWSSAALTSNDTNLLYADIFLKDLATGLTELVTVSNLTGQSTVRSVGLAMPGFPVSISADGRFVAFSSDHEGLVSDPAPIVDNVYVRDRQAGWTYLVATNATAPALSADGRFLAYNQGFQTYVCEWQIPAVPPVMVSGDVPTGSQRNSKQPISASGRYVAFSSTLPTGVVAVYLHDRDADGNGIFDEAGGILTKRVDVSSTGVPSNATPFATSLDAMSDDGRYIVFTSDATNLLGSRDRNNVSDVFVHDAVTGKTVAASVSASGKLGNGYSSQGASTGDGRCTAFVSEATNLVTTDLNLVSDVFLNCR